MSLPLRQAVPRLASAISRRAASSSSTADFSVQDVSGVATAAVDEGAPTGAITVVLKAGSRYETSPGLAHILKNFAFRETKKRTQLRITRETELYGGVLTASLDREHLYLTAEFLRGDEPFFAELLGDATTQARFADHELHEGVLAQVDADRQQALISPRVAALEAAHRAAFRNGLGNSLIAPAHPHVSAGAVATYAQSVVNSKGGVAVVGTGVAPDQLQKLVSDFFPRDSAAGSLSSAKSKYYGGEIRLPSDSGAAQALVIGFEGGSLHQFEYAVLRHLLGGETSVKWSRGSGSVLSQLLAKTPLSHEASAFNLAYSDTGLLGAYLSAPTPAEITELSKSFVSALDKAASGIADEDFKRAVAKAKFEAAQALESRLGRLDHVGAQIINDGKTTSLNEVFSAIDKVTPKAVQDAAKRARKSRPTVIAVGDSSALPYADEIGL